MGPRGTKYSPPVIIHDCAEHVGDSADGVAHELCPDGALYEAVYLQIYVTYLS